jgi:hypothetical protein
MVLVGIALCVFGGYFAAMGIFDRSPDNAVINYVLLAVPPLLLGGGIATVGWRTAKEELTLGGRAARRARGGR